jgi:hypothetical protein
MPGFGTSVGLLEAVAVFSTSCSITSFLLSSMAGDISISGDFMVGICSGFISSTGGEAVFTGDLDGDFVGDFVGDFGVAFSFFGADLAGDFCSTDFSISFFAFTVSVFPFVLSVSVFSFFAVVFGVSVAFVGFGALFASGFVFVVADVGFGVGSFLVSPLTSAFFFVVGVDFALDDVALASDFAESSFGVDEFDPFDAGVGFGFFEKTLETLDLIDDVFEGFASAVFFAALGSFLVADSDASRFASLVADFARVADVDRDDNEAIALS